MNDEPRFKDCDNCKHQGGEYGDEPCDTCEMTNWEPVEAE